MTTEVSTDSVAPPASPRLVSLDALRGFDMCWILGLEELVVTLLNKLNVPGKKFVTEQLGHVDWEGFHFYDLIFPLFLFIAGVSLSLSLPKRRAMNGTTVTALMLLERSAILFALGILYSGGFQKGLDEVRWLGVLQRIALGSCFAGLLSLWLSPRGLVIALVALLAGYWALLTFVPVPEFGAGNFMEGKNLTNYLDRIYLPGRRYDGDHDPEGILSTLPAIATALLGILAGRWIISTASPSRKVFGLIVTGALLLATGWAWDLQFPVIKKLWTSSFVLVAGGWSAILLGVFYYIVEVLGFKMWTKPLVWVGANPILLYVCAGLGFFHVITYRIIGPVHGGGNWPSSVSFALMLFVARFLYKRSIFLRV